MNKDIIKKYKAEFDWWLDGGEVLTLEHKVWVNGTDRFTKDIPHIINDEYVSYRKALAEGKTVLGSFFRDDGWSSFSPIDSKHSFLVSGAEYRIKPAEPKLPFDEGNYVVNRTEEIAQVCGLVYNEEEGYHSVHLLKHTRTYHPDVLKLWTLEDASDDEWVTGFIDIEGWEVQVIIQADEAKKEDTPKKFKPYIGQTPKQLGLEK